MAQASVAMPAGRSCHSEPETEIARASRTSVVRSLPMSIRFALLLANLSCVLAECDGGMRVLYPA